MARLAWTSEPVIIIQFLLTIVLLTLNFTSAGPAGQRSYPQCLSFCKESKNFQYEPGTTYVYDYATDIETSIIQGSQHKSHVRVTARAELEAVSACDLKLQLKNVRFEDLTTGSSEYERSDSFKDQQDQLELHSLLFGFQDGRIEQICSHQNDDTWVVNVKRGVISMIQNSLEDLSSSSFTHETDINGKCPTEYTVDGTVWGGGVSYKKFKDLTKCTSRQSQFSAIQSVPYSSSSPIQNIPLLSGKLECSQTVRNKRIENVLCQEEQRFQPFDEGNTGAKTTIAQSLIYASEHPAQRHNDENSVFVKRTLLFESEEPLDGTQDNSKKLLQLLEYLHKASFPLVTEAGPQLFVDFVEELRSSSESSIRKAFNTVKGSSKEKYLMEAMPLIGTASSLAVLRDLTLNDLLGESEQKSWLTALAFIKNPTVEMIKAVTPLLQDRVPSMEALLGISALVSSYCKYHPTCNEEIILNDILEKIISPIGNDCRIEDASIENVRQVVLRLKAVGNAGVLPVAEQVSGTPVVLKCLQDRNNPLEIRLAALDSLRRLPCQVYDNQDVLRQFTDIHENTEIRIKAFLTLMRCVDRQTMELIKSVLYSEPVNQVASFVWTFLTNLQETNRPEKQEIRDLMSNEFLINKFSTDARKFSRNYEASSYWEDWNIGAGVDSNVIFTEESFLPKSGMVNLTVQLFGESVNIFEFGLRTHGLEQLLEKFFGPQGYLPDTRVTEFLSSSRTKRDTSTQDDMEGLGYLYDQAKLDNEKMPGGSFYSRVFGHEIMYKKFEISDRTAIPNVVDETGKSWFHIRDILDNLSTGKKLEFSESMILFDTGYSVATCSGFPLSLSVQAAATVAMTAKGKINVGKFIETKELDVQGTLKPSSMVNVDGTLAIKIGPRQKQLQSGLKLHNTLRSSTAVEVNLLMKGKNIFKASVNIPQNKQEIIDISSQLLAVGPNGQALVAENSGEDFDAKSAPATIEYVSDGCSSQYWSDLIGMKLCMQMNVPNKISFTPVRPAYLKLYLEKIDEFTGYTVDYSYNSDPSTTVLNAVFDTPGSTVNRRVSADFLLDRGLGKIAGALESAMTSLRAEGTYTRFQKNLELSLVSQEKTNFLLSTGLRSDGNIVKPHFLATWHARPLVELKGTIDMTPQSTNEDKMTIEMNLKHLTETPVKVTGEITGSSEVKDATLAIESFILTGNVRSQLKRKPEHWSTKTSMEYSWKRGKVHTADLSAKLQRSRKGSLSKALVTAGFSSTQFPDNSADFYWETQTSSGFCENTLKLGWGKTSWEGHTLFSRQNQIDHSELRLETSLMCTKFNIDYRLEFAHRTTTEGFKTKFLGRTATDIELNANIEYISAVDDLLKKSLEATANWPNTDYSLKASFIEKQRGDFEAELFVHLNSTRDLKATALYINRSNNLRLDHNVEFRARGFTQVPLSGSLGFSATEKQSHVGLQVQFEGKKPYSSRISTSFDYSHTKYSHKLEGKVTLNEKKYNGEIFYMNNRLGGKNLTVDLQLENHIYIEASLKGMLPDPMLATLLVIPDKDKEPNSKVKVEGNLDPNSVAVRLDYFGDEISIGGRYDDSSVIGEVIWPQDQKFMVAVAVPKFSFEDAEIELDVVTSFDGFKTIAFTIQHTFGNAKLKSIVKGSVEDTEGNLNLAASFASNEITFSTDLVVTGYPKYEGNFLILRKSKRKSLQISMKAGERESLFDFDFIRLDEGYLGKIEFRGCSFFPRISMEVNHQFSVSQVSTYNSKIEWSDDISNLKQLALQIKHQNSPLSIEALFTSPWAPVEQVETSLIWNVDGANRQLSLTTKNRADKINTKVQLNVVGSMQNFRHELDGEWYTRTLRITVSGGINGLSDTNLHTIIKLPEHHVSYDFLSKKVSDKYSGEFRADVDNAITAAGIQWDFSSDGTQEKVASVWGQIPKLSPVSATLELISTNGKRTTKVMVNRNDTAIIDMVSVLQISGARHWDMSLVLKSEAQVIPSISFSSKHNLLDLNQIKHTSTLTLVPVKEEGFWLNSYIKARRVTVDLTVDSLEDIKGAVIFGDNDFLVTGKIQQSSNGKGYSSKINIASNKFHQLNFQGSYQNEDDEFAVAGELSGQDDNSIFKMDIDAVKTGEDKSGKILLTSAYTPSLEGFISMSSAGNWNLTTYLLKNSDTVFNLNVNGMVKSSVGILRTKLTSTSFPSIANLQLDVDYKFAKTNVDGKVRFQDNNNIHMATVESTWGDHVKKAKGSYNGSTQFSFEAALEGMSQLVAHAIYNGQKLGEISVSYRPEQGGYSLGKHGVYITFTDNSGVTQNFNFIVGLDSKKIFVNVQTPFTNWTDVVVDGQISSSSVAKGIKFLLQREDESIQGAFESKNSRKTGTLQISAELSVIGFSKLRQMLLERAQATDINGLSAVNPQKFTFQLTWSSSNFNVKVETPVDVLNKLSFSGNWELKKPQKFLIISGQINEEQYDLKANVQHEQNNCQGKLSLSSDDYSVQVDYDFSNDYESSLFIETPNQQWNLGGKIIIKPNLIGLEMTTPFKNFESVSLSAQQEFPSTNQALYSLSWDINGQSDKIELTYEIDQGRVELRATTPFSPWNSVVFTVIYDTPFKHFTLHSQRGDGQEVKINFEMDSSGNMTYFESPATSSIHIAIETPVEQFEDIKFSLLYNRNNLMHSANLSVSRNDGETEGKLNLMFQHSDPVALDISAFLTSPFLASKATAHASLLVDPTGESTVSAHVQANGKRYEMYGLSQLTSAVTKLEMRTSLPFLRQVKFLVKKGNTINMHGAWTGNNKHVEIHGDVLCTGFRSSRVSFNVSTPTDLMGSFGFEGEIGSKSGVTNAKVVFQNHEVRWLAKVDRVQGQDNEDWRLQVNTPLSGYKHVVISLNHLKNSMERNVVAVVQINKKEMSMRLGFKNQTLDMVLASELSYLPVQAKINANWEKHLILAVSTSTGNNEYGTSFHLNLQGISHGNFDFAISSMQHLNTVVEWKFQGDCDQGHGWLNVENSLVGRKSMRSTWRNQNWQMVIFDLWMKTGLDENENGVTLQYKVTPHVHYGSIEATVNYTLSGTEETETILFEASLDEQASHLKFDTVLKTPFQDFEVFQVKGQLKMKNEIGFNIDASLNDDKLISADLNLITRPLNSEFSVKLDIPLVTDPLELECSYDITTANKVVSVLFKQNIYAMDLKLSVTIPTGSSQVDIKLKAESTVPTIPLDVSGTLRMEYAVSNDGTRQISIHLNGDDVDDWKLLVSLRPTAKLHSKIIFEGPLEILPSLMAELNFAGNIRQGVSSNATVILDGAELTSSILIDRKQWRSNFKYVVGSDQHYAGEGQINFNDDNTELDVRYNDGDDYDLHISGSLKVTAETKLGNGIVTVTSGSSTAVPISFEVVMENQQNILVIGTNNEKNFRLEADLKGYNGTSWVNDGETSLKMEGNIFGGESISFELQSNHYIREQEMSLNITIGEDFTFESYARTSRDAALFAKLNWFALEEIKLDAKLLPSNVDFYLKVPSYVDAHLLADYGSSEGTTFVNGVFMLSGEKSTLNASLTRERNQSVCKAILDVPSLKQKIDMEITTFVRGEKTSQNLSGEVNLIVNDQEFQISGGLKTQVFDSGRGEHYIERVLQVSSNFTTNEVTTVGLELFVRKPLKSYSSLNIVGTLNINDQVSTLSGDYELPSQESPFNDAGIFAKLQSTYLPSDENYEFFVKLYGKALKKVEAKLNYKVTRFDVLWDFLNTTSVLSFSYSGKTDDGERLLLQSESILDPSQNVKLSINCHGWDTHYTFRTSLVRQKTAITGHLFIDAPQILASTNEYKITVTTNDDGSYALEASAVRGRLVMELVGDASINLNNLNIVVKAMGSYGSHYAMIVGNRNGGGHYGFELTAESSSLLVGKRVNVRGNMTIDERTITTVLQCRARRNIHELSASWSREDDGAGKLNINLISPSVDPAKLNAEWSSQGKVYFGKLSIQIFNKNHEAELGLNLNEFEGKFHIVSPLLPSNEFNFHVKSIVNTQNVNLMADIMIRGSHWRLEGVATFTGLRNMVFKIEARTPFAFFDRLTLGIKCVQDEVYLEVHTPVKYIPNVMFKLGGIQTLEQGIWHKLKPNLVIAVPNGKYSAMASLEAPRHEATGTLHILLQYLGTESKTLEAYAEISPLKTFKLQMETPGHLQVKLVTPFQTLRQVGLNVEGVINSKRSGKLQITGAFNSHEGKFDASFDNSNGNMQALTRLITNIPKYEKSAFAIAIETFQGIGQGKSFHVEFVKPDWENLFRLDADYRYKFESLLNLEGEINMNMDSYMSLPPLHAHLTSGMKNSRYSGALEGSFGPYRPALKVEAENQEAKITVFVEGKAGENDRYNIINTFEMIPLQNDFSIKEKLHWRGEQVVDLQVFQSDDDELCEGHLTLSTPWGLINSKGALTPITFLTMNEDLSISQLLKNANVTLEVHFQEKKIVGLEIVSRDGMRLFEIHNPIRPVSLSVAVEKVDWNSLRLKAGVCWDLKVPEKSSIGLDAYLYRKSTGITMGGYVAGADYGIVIAKFEHFFSSSKFSQNLMIKWNAHAGKLGDIGYALNYMDKKTGFKRLVDYGFRIVVPSRSVLISGIAESDQKYAINNLTIAWDVLRSPEKILKVNISSQRSTTWRTSTVSRAIELHHVAWNEPIVFSVEQTLIHDILKQIEVKVKPSLNPSSHLSGSASWEGGDWTSFVAALIQPSSKIDIEAKYNITEQNKMLRLTHMLSTGDYKLFAVSLDKTLNSQNLIIRSGDMSKPRTLTALSTQSSLSEHSVKATLLHYQLSGRIHTSLPYLDVVLRQDNANKLHVVCGLPHPKEIIFKASRSQFTKTINDASFLLRLNSTNLLSTRIHWRPDVLDEIAEYDWLRGSKNVLNTLLPSFPEFSAAVRNEVEGHWVLFSSPVKSFLTSLYEISSHEINMILRELQVVGSRIRQLYARNAFYLKDIVEVLQASVSPLVTAVKNCVNQIRKVCTTVCHFMMNAGKTVSNLVVKYFGRLEVHVMQAWEDVEQIIVDLWNRNAAWIQMVSEELEEYIDALIEALEGKIEMLEEKLMAVGFVKSILQVYRDYATWLDEIPLDDYVDAIEEFFQIKVWDKLEALFGPYLEAVRNALDDEYIKELLETPPIPYIRFVLKQTKNAMIKLWNVIELEEKMKDLVRHALKNLDGLMQRNFPTWQLEWDIDNGIIEYDQSLSFIEWTDFTQSPRWRMQAQETEEVNQLTNLYYQIMDYIENLKPIFDMRIREVLPPFGGLAMMAGDHHYYTFDKKYFRFAGECSYVLVVDLLHNGFSYIVNYETRDGVIRKKSYTIALAEHNIEIDVSTFKVTVDSKKVELPTKVDTVYIRRQETRLDIYDVRGYQIACTLSPSVCTFSTSGWYYGKLAGLLGTYDNELVNDFRSPDGEIISDIPTFAYSWRVGKSRNQCRMKNFARDETEPTDVDNICYDLLTNRNSPLRPCFNTVDTTIFMEMCKYDVSRNINSASRSESACTSMSAYVTECQKHNVDVWMPPTCVRCKLEDGHALTTGENATLQTNSLDQKPPSSSDIVILLEEKECMDQLDISIAIAKLEASLRAEGITDNRYALVGFGGQGIHLDAHIQTSSAHVWAHSTLFKVPEKHDVIGVRKSDLYGAIHFASTMTYRAGVSKTLLAITCGDEKCGDSVRYSDTLTLLVENDFKLHMITPKPFTIKGKKKQDESNRILGFDANGVYTMLHAKRNPLVADPSFKRHLNLPKDLCTPLAVETNGTRFTSDNLTKKMLDVWARRVAQSAHPSECQRCECVPDKNGGSRLMCHQCVSPSLWKFMEEWKNYQSQEVDDILGLEMLDPEPFLLPPS